LSLKHWTFVQRRANPGKNNGEDEGGD